MKIVIWIDKLGKGGAEWVITQLAKGFHARGHKVTLYVVKAEAGYESHLPQGVDVVHLRSGREVFPSLSKRSPRYIFRMAKYMRKEAPDILLSSFYVYNAYLPLVRYFSNAGFSTVARESNTLSRKINGMKSRFRRWFVRRYVASLYPRNDAIITPSQGVMDDLSGLINQASAKMAVVPNPVDVAAIQSLKTEPLPKEASIGNRPFIMSAGRLVPQKGFKTLIRAWARIAGDVDLLILGEGLERHDLQALAASLDIEDRLYMPGFDDNPYRYMARASGFVLSSYYEGLPNVLLQALACGCPVVATDCESGPREILGVLGTGQLIPVGDDCAMTDAIRAVLHAAQENNKVPDQVARLYDQDAICDRYLACFNKVINTRRSKI